MIETVEIRVCCDDCGTEALFDLTSISNIDRALEKSLEADGWHSTKREHLCPECKPVESED